MRLEVIQGILIPFTRTVLGVASIWSLLIPAMDQSAGLGQENATKMQSMRKGDPLRTPAGQPVCQGGRS